MPKIYTFALLIVALFCLPAFGQSTANNTSGCSANGIATAGCNGVGTMPFSTDPGNIGAQTVVVDPLPTNVSTLSPKTMMYSGYTGALYYEIQPWFCNTSTPCNGHLNIGMQMSNTSEALAQMQWIKTLGGDAGIIDWYGCSSHCVVPQSGAQLYNQQVTEAEFAAVAANPSTTAKLGLMLDQGAIDGSGTGQCAPASGDQSVCLEGAIETQMDYAAQNWFFQAGYVTNPANGHPIFLFFVDHTMWPDTNFNTVFAAVAAHATSGQSCGTSCTYTKTIDLIDENNGAFSETGVAGGYSWLSPIAYSITNQFCYLGNCPTGNYYSSFYATARANPTKMAIGTIKKGFDDGRSFGSNRVTAQQCGMIPSLMAAAVSTAGYTNVSQISAMMVDTLNDYEEGTAVEAGIDNCITISQPVISGGTIAWSLTKGDPVYASLTTINKFQIWTGTGTPTVLFADGISSSATSHAAPTLTAGQSAWVYMVGQPLIQNRLSPASIAASPGSCNSIPVPTGTTGCFYLADSGNDANDGSTEVVSGGHGPWLHAPGMRGATGIPASFTPSAGQAYIFRGGDTWHFGNASMVPYVGSCIGNSCWPWPSSGAAGSPIYIGVDKTWFAGGTFARPIFNGDNTVTTARPSTCNVKDFQAANAVLIGTHDYVQFDNFEFTGFCNGGTSGVSAGMLNLSGAHATATNLYFHGYTMPTGATDDEYYAIQGGNGTGFKNAPGSQCLNNVFDNSDGTNGNVGVWPNGKATMGAIQNACSVVAYSVFNRVSNGIVSASTSVHDNSFIDLYDPSLSGNTNHGNIWNSNNDPLTNVGTQQFYNNVFRNINEGVSVWLMPTPTAYIFNNVEWNNFNSANCYVIGGSSQVTGLPLTTVYFYNNTSDAPCTLRGLNNGSDPVWKGTVNFANNHYVGYSPALLSSTYSADAGTLPIWTDLGNELFQTEAAANAQGYVPSNFYAPTLGGSSIAAGQNLTSSCATQPSLCRSTSQGVIEQAGSGGKVAIYPATTITARPNPIPPNWDIGAYQFVPFVSGGTSGNAIYAVQPPQPSGTNHNAYTAVLALNNPLLSGQTIIVGLGGTQGFDQETGTAACAPDLTAGFALWDPIVGTVKTNFLLTPGTEGGTNTFTPQCVFSQAWANAVALSYGVAGATYLPGDYILTGGNYWQVANNAYSSPSLDNLCAIAGGASFSGAGPVVDGSCKWTKIGANAPTQNGFCGNNFKCGVGASSCYQLNGNAAIVININSLGPCNTTTLYQSEPLPQELPIRTWMTAVLAQVIPHYNGLVGYIRVGSPAGGELSPLGIGSGLWPNYGATTQQQRAEYLSWVKILDTQIMADGPTMSVCHDMNNAGSGGDQTYSDQEAQLAHDLNFDCIGTNGFQVNDVVNLLNSPGAPHPCAFPLVSSATCGSGDWPYNFSRFLTNAAGKTMHHTLQTLTGSTPFICTPNVSPQGLTGPLGPLPVGSTYCAPGFPGLLPFLATAATTGISGQKIIVDRFEMYVNGPNGNTNAGTGAQAYPAGDVLLALNQGYCTLVNSQCTAPADYRSAVNSYQASMALYLNTTYSLGVQPPTNVTFTIGTPAAGPPYYPGSRTDLAVAPPGGFIAVPPQVGPNVCTAGNLLACGNVLGVNTIVTDPDFGTQISRMTDANSVLNANTVQTADSGGANISNCTGTVTCGGTGPTYVILKSTGGNRWLFQFNPATMITSPAGALIGNFVASWAHTHPYRAYYMNGTILTQMDVTPGTQTFSTTPIYDFGGTQCLGNSVNGQNPYSLVWTGVLQPSFDDNVFGLGFGNQPGGQDHGYHFASYNIATGHCTVVNTSTGIITDNGSSIGSVSFPERFLLHEGHSEPNPTYAVLIPTSGAGCLSGVCAVGPYLYTVGTTTAISCAPSSACSGETASGSLSLMQGNGTGNLNVHNYASWQTTHPLITNSTLIPTGLASCAGNVNHPSWNNNDGTDTLPIFTSYSGTCTTFNAAWQKEIIGYSQDGSKVWRPGHNFSSGINSQFDISNAIAQMSQDGRFIFVGSDWLGTLGPAQSLVSGTCILATTCRGDVFAYRLQ